MLEPERFACIIVGSLGGQSSLPGGYHGRYPAFHKDLAINLRNGLRQETRALHDRLDRELGAPDFNEADSYRRFLEIQLAARAPLERWARAALPDTLRPPELCALLQADLADLATGPDGPSPTASQAVEREQIIAFTLPEGADPRGAAWAIGGSAMGGRMMLHSLRGSGRDDLPSRFLASEDALAFWHALKPRLEIECTAGELRSAVAAARAVFLHFLHAASRTVPEPAE